jgi:hypothetical protein
MQPRTLAQILAETNSIYDPQVASVQQQIGQLPGQTAAEEQGLQAKQTQAFGDILNGARRRNLGFSGIPLAEQAQYTATNYLPALANLHTAQNQRATSLQDAILGIRERQNQYAQGIYQQEQDRALQARAAADQAAAYRSLFGGQQSPTPAPQAPAADPYAGINKNNAYASVAGVLNSGNVAAINSFLNAITASAKYGNVYDQYKLDLVNSILQGDKTSAFDPRYANLIKQAQNYVAPAPKKNTVTKAKEQVNEINNNPLSGLSRLQNAFRF